MTTRERVKAIVAASPEKTMADIARELGVSRERVRQIALTEGLTIRSGVLGIGERRTTVPKSRLVTGGVPVPITHSVAGTIGELLAAADLMARGFMVFFPLVRTGMCDLIALDRAGKCERIEVRCGYRSGKAIVWDRPDKSKSDRRAIVLTGEPVRYQPPLE